MKLLSLTIKDRTSTFVRDIGLRTGMIILRLLEDMSLIESWPKGRAEVHWKDDSVKIHVTKVQE